MRYRAVVATVAVVLVVTMLAGCQRGFNRQAYETVLLGEPASQVQKKLGKPTAQSGEVWTYVNEMPYYRAEIEFKEGKVAEKRWYVEKQGKPKECDRRLTY